MISNQDRSKWFGASDTQYIVGNWNTASWRKWWLVKLGLSKNNFQNIYTLAGTHYEHKILDSLGIPLKKDKQIKIRSLRLRVNYDGVEVFNREVKTYRYEKGFKLSKQYLQQAYIETFANGKDTIIHAYGLLEDDYKNYFNAIDLERLSAYKIKYDINFINDIYLPKLKILCEYMKRGTMP